METILIRAVTTKEDKTKPIKEVIIKVGTGKVETKEATDRITTIKAKEDIIKVDIIKVDMANKLIIIKEIREDITRVGITKVVMADIDKYLFVYFFKLNDKRSTKKLHSLLFIFCLIMLFELIYLPAEQMIDLISS